MATVGGVARSVPATPQRGSRSASRRSAPPGVLTSSAATRRRLAGRGLGGRAAAAGRARLRRHGAGRQGLAGHPGQRLVLPLRLAPGPTAAATAPPSTPTAWRTRWAPQFGAWADHLGTLADVGHRHRHRRAALHRRAFALTERLPTLDLAAARVRHRDPRRHPERGHRPLGHPDLRPLAGAARLPDHRRPHARRPGAALLPQPGRLRRGAADRRHRARPDDRARSSPRPPATSSSRSPAAQGGGVGARA